MLGHKLCQVLSAESVTFTTFRAAAPDLAPFYSRTEPIAGVDALEFDSVSDAIARARPQVVDRSGAQHLGQLALPASPREALR